MKKFAKKMQNFSRFWDINTNFDKMHVQKCEKILSGS